MNNQKPTISVITVVYNAVDLLEGTIQSVLNQSYPHIEYVIVDGASKDGTLDLIKQYQDRIHTWVSEPDKGLYDAMNKGLSLATGDYVWFVNAGDQITGPEMVEKMIAHWTPQTDVLFGEVMIVDENRQPVGTRSERTVQKLPEKLDWKSLQRGMVVSHQGFLPRRAICGPYLLDNWTADIDWVINCLKKAKVTTHTHLVIAEFLEGGVSTQKHRAFMLDRYKVLQKHYGFLPNLFAHAAIVWRAFWWKLRGN